VLRHTFASILIAQRHAVVFVSRQLGHANAAIRLKVYAHWFDAAWHAEVAPQRLSEDYRDVLRRREAPGRQLGFDL
jgi:integrase